MSLNTNHRGKKIIAKSHTHPHPIRPLLPSNIELPVSISKPRSAKKYFQNFPIFYFSYFIRSLSRAISPMRLAISDCLILIWLSQYSL